MDLCTQSLLVLVNDILEFSKLEAGKVQVSRQPTLLNKSMASMVEFFHAAANERGVVLKTRIDTPDDLWLLIDGDRVRQIVANLLGNALKFTQEGQVEVHVHQPDSNRLNIDVRDTGIGVSEEDRVRLFEPFVQAGASTTRRFGGTGLGLTISRQLAIAMDGDVELVHSDTNGSHFRLSIVVEASNAPNTSKGNVDLTITDASFDGVHILVAEDDLTNQRIARKMLEKLGVVTTVVSDGLHAVSAAQKGHFDLILMDLMMPNLNGMEATFQIRSGEGPCSRVPIVAFSAAALGSDRDAAIAAGMSGFIEKPARLAGLREALTKHLGCRS
jgi:two-component system, sensor histidine kinase